FSSRRRHTRFSRDWSSDVCSSDLMDSARSCATCAQGVQALNAAIPAWAASESTAQSPVIFVDQWTGFDTDADTYDGVHPNASGRSEERRVGKEGSARWLDA